MSSTTETKPTRGRVARAEEEQQRRRRRGLNDNDGVKRLALPEDKLDRSNYVFRWVNDTPGRIAQLHGQDWDLVTPDELGVDFPNERHADVAANRLPLTTRLMKKRKEYYEEDHALRQKRIDDEMKAAELGRTVLNGPNPSDGLQPGDARVYQPRDAEGTNKL